MNIGRLRHLCVLYSKDTTRDPDNGSSLEQYTLFSRVYADIASSDTWRGGKEIFLAETLNAEVTHIITIRYLNGVKADMRLTYENVNYDIKAVIDSDVKHELLTLLATTGVSNV